MAGEELLARLLDRAEDAIVVTGPGDTIVSWNDGARRLYGWTAEEAAGRPLDELLRTLPGDASTPDEVTRTTREGHLVTVQSRSSKVESAQLEITREIGVTVAELRASIAEKSLLLRETHHRVKNNLAVIAALLAMRADASDNAELIAALQQSEQRVRSIALIHELLYGTEQLNQVPFGEYIRQLVAELENALGAGVRGISVIVETDAAVIGAVETLAAEADAIKAAAKAEAAGPAGIGLEPRQAVPCALILNELVTNALKHAFPGTTQTLARVTVSFHRGPNGQLELAVEDNGQGIREDKPNKGLGIRIVDTLTRQLGGTITREPCEGTRCVLRFPEAPR